MPLDYQFDPETGDLVRDGKGGFVLVSPAQTAIYEQMQHHYPEWWGAPEQGSLLHKIRSFVGSSESKRQQAQAEVARALQQLADAGRIDALAVTAEINPRIGRIVVGATARDTSTGAPVTVKRGA